MSSRRRLAFARARASVAAALAAFEAEAGMRRSVFIGPRNMRRVAPRDRALAAAAMPPRGCEDLH